jgi:hypothetical protein
MYDHKFPKTQLDLPRKKKKGEGDVLYLESAVLKPNPGWRDEIPSACKTPPHICLLATHVIYFAPVLIVCRRRRDPGKASKEPIGKGVDRIGRGSLVLVDLAAARSHIKVQEVPYRCQVGDVHPFAETVLSGGGLIGDREPSLEQDFWHF